MEFQTTSPSFSHLEYDINIIKLPDNPILPIGETLPTDGFFIGYTVKDNVKYYQYEVLDDEWILNRISFGAVHTCLSFHVCRDRLSTLRLEISRMLDAVINISLDVQEHFIQTIQGAMLSIANDPAYAAPRIMPMLVDITRSSSYDVTNSLSFSAEEDVDINVDITDQINEVFSFSLEEVLNLSLEEYVFNATPAARSAIELLPTVKFDAADEQQQKDCRICLDDFLQDAEVISMPCKHLFHGECITNWLEKSNLCPLCRFEMPVGC